MVKWAGIRGLIRSNLAVAIGSVGLELGKLVSNTWNNVSNSIIVLTGLGYNISIRYYEYTPV